jgi:hypothetical protein
MYYIQVTAQIMYVNNSPYLVTLVSINSVSVERIGMYINAISLVEPWRCGVLDIASASDTEGPGSNPARFLGKTKRYGLIARFNTCAIYIFSGICGINVESKMQLQEMIKGIGRDKVCQQKANMVHVLPPKTIQRLTVRWRAQMLLSDFGLRKLSYIDTS